MGKHICKTSQNGEHVFSFTWKGLVASAGGVTIVLGLLLLIGRTAKEAVDAIATKTDVQAISTMVGPRLDKAETRIYNLELANAAHFGASPASIKQNASTDIENDFRFLLTDFPQVPQLQVQASAPAIQVPIPAQRRVVVPQELINAYHMQPSRGGVYGLLGEDGKTYSLDDVLAVIIQLHLQEKSFQQRLK